MNYRGITVLLTVFAMPFLLQAQTGTVTGRVTDAETGTALAGANVIVEGTTLGAAADGFGDFTIANVPAGTYTITASVIGYMAVSQTADVPAEGYVTVNFALEAMAIRLSGLEVLASRATRETPVAYTNITKADMSLRLGSRDIPLILNTTPSVYATEQGGGAGDARVNVRGFNQRNVAIMINGVPVNDMENGWVYWSNWDGVGDATSSIQMQRGLSAVNLATPSIGGTMNIITDPTAHRAGGIYKQEIGAWGFLKSTLNYNTGLIGDKLAMSGTVVRKTGDGYAGATWTDAWAYYFGASYALSDKDRLEFYALGAPQRHGQNIYRQNIAAYSHSFAEGLADYDTSAFSKHHEAGRDYSQNYSPVTDYDGEQFWQMYTVRDGIDRHETDLLNSRENYFNKPQVSLNWYHTFNEQMRLSSIVYYSGGKGGGTGTLGDVMHESWEGDYNNQTGRYYFFGSPWSWDWDATIAINRDSTHYWIDQKEKTKAIGQSVGIIRNSVNQQWTIGAISKLNFDLSENIKTIVGIDWRTAEIGHWREVRDLLGGDYYRYTGNQFETTEEEYKKVLGDIIAYNFTNTVDWLGLFAQGEYSGGPLTAYGMFGWSRIAYTYANHFRTLDTLATGEPDPNGAEIYSAPPAISTIQIKGGASFKLAEGLGLFGNLGLVKKPPIFDNVIDDYQGITNDSAMAETFTSFEGGVYFSGLGGMLNLNANYYNTTWKDRSYTRFVVMEDGEEGMISLKGVDANHSGFELECAFQPLPLFRLDVAASLSNWKHLDDVEGTYRPDFGEAVVDTFNFYIKDLKVGDAPQTQVAVTASVFPIKGMTAQLVYKYYDKNYADWSPFSRLDEDYPADGGDRGVQSWMAPSYAVMDLHAAYDLPFSLGGVKLQVFTHVFNLLDTAYIQDATDNSPYNAWDYDHDADDAEVFYGIPRKFNVGLSVRF